MSENQSESHLVAILAKKAKQIKALEDKINRQKIQLANYQRLAKKQKKSLESAVKKIVTLKEQLNMGS